MALKICIKINYIFIEKRVLKAGKRYRMYLVNTYKDKLCRLLYVNKKHRESTEQ